MSAIVRSGCANARSRSSPRAGDGTRGHDLDARGRRRARTRPRPPPRRPSTRSALESTTIGTAPLSNARTSSRSRRRMFGPLFNACTTKTRSTLAATTCGRRARPSPASPRTNADRRGNAAATLPCATRIQSPVATVCPASWARSVPAAVITVAQPRSTRATRPGTASGRDNATAAAANSASQPRFVRATGSVAGSSVAGIDPAYARTMATRTFDVERLSPADNSAVIAALARAFYDDPLFGYFLPDLVAQSKGLLSYMARRARRRGSLRRRVGRAHRRQGRGNRRLATARHLPALGPAGTHDQSARRARRSCAPADAWRAHFVCWPHSTACTTR